MTTKPTKLENELPKIGAPATRALNGAGYFRLEQLDGVRESELAKLHGVGPRALRILKEALKEKGLAFASEK